MIEAVDIRYEATDISPQIEGDLAVLVMVTEKGRVAVHMQRAVFLGLHAEMKQALEQ